jgi:hypothetical protein
MTASNLLLDFVTYSIAQGWATVGGTNVFADNMPDSPDNCIAFIEYPGQSSFIANADLRSIQVRVRNSDYETGRQLIWDIYNTLYKPESDTRFIDLTVNRWVLIKARHTPYLLNRDETKRCIFILNMGVTTSRDE